MGACCTAYNSEDGELIYSQQGNIMLEHGNKGNSAEDLEAEFDQIIREIELNSSQIKVKDYIYLE